MAWDVDRLINLSKHFPRVHVPLADIREIDAPFCSDEETPSWRAVVEHMRLIEAADLDFAVILSAEGRVMDGMHRVARVVLLGRTTIDAVRITRDPEPDYVGVSPQELPYEETPDEPTNVA